MSIESNILFNMYYQGSISTNKGGNMGTFNSFNKDYIIEFERNSCKLWQQNSIGYICKFIFKNNIGVKLFEVNTSVNDIFVLIDNMLQYDLNDMSEIVVPIFGINSNMKMYNFTFLRNLKVYRNTFLTINEYDNVTEQIMTRATIEFDEDSLNEFRDIIYFSFLIDIDNGDGTYEFDYDSIPFY